jgi:hypothetical protein
VLPEPVIDRQAARQPPVAFLRVLEGHRVALFPAEGLDKALGLAVGAGRDGPCADVPEAKGAAGLGESFGDVGRAVVAHHLPALHALSVEPGHSPAQEADGRGLLLVSEALDVGLPCASSIATWTRSYPTSVERPCCRLPVMRCPTSRKRASFLTSMWIGSCQER